MKFEVEIVPADLSRQLAHISRDRETYLVQQNNRITARMNYSENIVGCCGAISARKNVRYERLDIKEYLEYRANTAGTSFEITCNGKLCATLQEKKMTVMKKSGTFKELNIRPGYDLIHILALCQIIHHIHGAHE